MFSLIITLISIALVAALALATLYYGGGAFNEGRASAEAAKLRNQGQQLMAAAELYRLQTGQWPGTVQDMVDGGYLKSVPVAQGAVPDAFAGTTWRMPAAQVPVFVMTDVSTPVCRKINEGSYGLPGVLPELRDSYAQQCYGSTTTDLKMVAQRGSTSLQRAATQGDGTISPGHLTTAPVPSGEDTASWTVPPFEGSGGTPGSGEPTDPEGPANPVDPEEPPPEAPAAVTADPATLEFALQATNTTETLTVVVQNSGGLAAQIVGAPSISGHPAYTIASTTCGAVLSAGASCSVSVNYAPTSVGAGQLGALTLALTEGAPVEVALSGSAYNPVSLGATALPQAKRNRTYEPFSFQSLLTVANETSPDLGQVQWEAQGTLPQGLSFTPETGTLGGMPTELTSGEGASFTVRATYKNNQGQRVYAIQVGRASLEVTQISAGSSHTCAVTPAGGVKCWGNDDAGQLGDDSALVNQPYPVDVSGLTSGVAFVSAGSSHTCALTTGGGVKCWGFNNAGRLGDGSTTNRPTPVNVTGYGTSGAAKLSAGRSHTCIVTTAGASRCWGEDAYGQLGDNATLANQSTSVVVSGLGAGTTASIDAGDYHTCAVLSTGALRCWGRNNSGQLGDGTTTQRPTPVTISGAGSNIASVDAGNAHTCAVTTGGGVKCWGWNNRGQVGDGSIENRSSPVDVQGLGSGVVQVVAGNSHSCGRMTSGGVRCWGRVANVDNHLPVEISGLSASATGISAHSTYTCASLSNGTAQCWGTNVNNAFGNDPSLPFSASAVDVWE